MIASLSLFLFAVVLTINNEFGDKPIFDPYSFFVARNADFEVSEIGEIPGPVYVGDEIVLTISAFNRGPDRVRGSGWTACIYIDGKRVRKLHGLSLNAGGRFGSFDEKMSVKEASSRAGAFIWIPNAPGMYKFQNKVYLAPSILDVNTKNNQSSMELYVLEKKND